MVLLIFSLFCSAWLVKASRLQQGNEAQIFPVSQCCCRTETIGDEDVLRCQTLEQKDLSWYSYCPSDFPLRADDVMGSLSPAAWRGCDFSWHLGPVAQACKTTRCVCRDTVDVDAKANGRLKGTVLSHTKEREVAVFYSVPFASYSGRWQHASSLPVAKPSAFREASDHCSMPFLYQLRTGATDALHRGSYCFQWLPALGRFGMESCLTLDVYTPAIARVPDAKHPSPYRLRSNASLPVMVFIEGGGFLVGDKYQQGIYDGRKLVDKQNVVLVNVNYRLGVMGFLHHPHLQDKSGQHLTNFGLRDQLEALRWVKENIASFGGDPKRVTLVGESAGAMSICAHLASPVARELFSNVIMESTNCDGFFIWMPQRFAEDWGARYIRAVFGRIRACDSLKGAKLNSYKESQNDCSPDDTASVATVLDRCADLFLGLDVENTLESRERSNFVELLPLEWTGGCDGIYRGCQGRPLQSGLHMDDALLQCAGRLDPGHVWVNQFGIIERHALEKASYMEEIMGMAFTGMPLPPHLPWAPVVEPQGPKELHYAQGGGLLTLPQKVFMEDESPLHLGSITAGFNRDEGTLFALLVPHFLGYMPRFADTSGMSPSTYHDILEQLACPDYGPSCVKESCHTDQQCGSRLAKLMKEYDIESKPSLARGSCCSKDPNTLRVQRMLTDYLFVCPTLRFLETMEKRTAGATALRLYEFDVDDELPRIAPDLKNTLGAFHVSELFFVYGNEDGPGGNLPLNGGAFGLGLGFTKQDVHISKKMSDSWGALVRQEDVPLWPNLTSQNRAIRFALDVPHNVDYISKGMIKKLHHCKVFDELKLEMGQDLK